MQNSEDYIFTWISLINIDKIIFIKLIHSNISIEEFYSLSLVPEKLKKCLIQNNIFISKDLFLKITDNLLKEKSKILYNFLISNDFKIIHIFSKEYSKIFLNSKNSPIVIFLYGNINLLKKNKSFIYLENDEDHNSKTILNKLDYSLNKKEYILVKNKKVDKKVKCKKIELLKIKDVYSVYKNHDIKSLYIFSNYDYYNFISSIIDNLVIINAKYKKDIVYLVDSMLDEGKDIFVFPNNILDKNAYFSNYLISEGAKIVLNIKDMFEK